MNGAPFDPDRVHFEADQWEIPENEHLEAMDLQELRRVAIEALIRIARETDMPVTHAVAGLAGGHLSSIDREMEAMVVLAAFGSVIAEIQMSQEEPDESTKNIPDTWPSL